MKKILFIEQPTFPRSKEERLSLCDLLCDLARRNPDKQIVIKQRFDKKVGHAHVVKFLLSDLITHPPENLVFDSHHIHDLITDSDIEYAVTLSSTAALEALIVGVPVYFLKDFGSCNNKYGVMDFAEIGTTISNNDLLGGKLPDVNWAKVEYYVKCDGKATERIVDFVLSQAHPEVDKSEE